MVTIEKLLKEGVNIIEKREFNSPFLEAQLILCHLLKRDKIYLHLNRKEEVSKEVAEKFYSLAEKRNKGYPIQYITNSQEFMGIEFYVQEGVLVPRPDTETLVEKIIKIVENKFNNKEVTILDIGTGSGAIGISLAYYLKNSKVTGIDISDTAIETANINIEKHNLKNIKILKGDIFNDFPREKYHIVVSNPPYIESEEILELQTEVSTYEPKLALDGGRDGLKYYRRIVEVFREIHGKEGILSVEIGSKQKEAVEKIFKDSGLFNIIETDKDLYGNNRVVTGYAGSVMAPT
jgi:release factor glutamine methyltransferase